jgi:hypothetical protein
MADLSTRFTSWKDKAERALATVRNVREKAAKPLEIGIQAAEIQGAAFLTGLYKGRSGDPEVAGVPVDLVGGLALIGVGIVMGGKTSDHLVNLGNGVTAAYSSQSGYGVGLEMAAKANNTTVAQILDRRTTGKLDNGQPDPDAQRQLAGGR